jgi:hypothetical protein
LAFNQAANCFTAGAFCLVELQFRHFSIPPFNTALCKKYLPVSTGFAEGSASFPDKNSSFKAELHINVSLSISFYYNRHQVRGYPGVK